ncbi:hypothetical protein, partial [Streptomyces pseudogriseolus]|uniref:hypothetical protein n=1 Tax=Streptomyces pseudogriseolus TaxID=36817 RepID=UPI003FA1E2D1
MPRLTDDRRVRRHAGTGVRHRRPGVTARVDTARVTTGHRVPGRTRARHHRRDRRDLLVVSRRRRLLALGGDRRTDRLGGDPGDGRLG